MPRHIKTIHIMDEKALDWYEKQENKFQYITDLILKDMRDKEQYVTRADIKNIIKEALNEMDIMTTPKQINENITPYIDYSKLNFHKPKPQSPTLKEK